MNTTSVHFPEAVQKALGFASITEAKSTNA
jgi:hypothetical protein